MSVSHPLLKKLKSFILEFRLKPEPVTDAHEQLLPLCETLESIFQTGLKVAGSWFHKPTYWTWISKLPNLDTHDRPNPILYMAINTVKKYKKTQSDIGRGRNFIRAALVRRILSIPVLMLSRNTDFAASWYNENDSILGNEILIEILHSLLLELNAVTFTLQLKNASFLDVCWGLPVLKQYELVPCEDLGVHLRTVKGYPVVTSVTAGSVAGEDSKIEVGDILDEMCGECLISIGKANIYNILHACHGYPIQISVIKSADRDGNTFGPIGKLLEKANVNSDASPNSNSPIVDSDERLPPEALLPDEPSDEVPVHDSEGRSRYETLYLGKAFLGKNGQVAMIETGVRDVLNSNQVKQDVLLDLGEKDITVSDKHTGKKVLHHLFTEVSACGRRTDAMLYFAFIAGETYCSLAKDFYCHVFLASSEEQAKVILCTIAQGFDRTHLMT